MKGPYAATLMIDASWCPETGASGYGYWIASHRGKTGGGGPIKDPAETSNLAEMQAVCIVLYLAEGLGFIREGEEVLVQTDCMAAILGLHKERRLTIAEHNAWSYYHSFGLRYNVTLRHVKGHSRSRAARHIANNSCDIRAKIAMREMRKKILEAERANIHNTTRSQSCSLTEIQEQTRGACA